MPNLKSIIAQDIPRIVPPNWTITKVMGVPGLWRDTSDGLRMLYTIDTLEGGKLWRHISMSRRDRYPAWDEMTFSIRACGFFDNERDVLMVLPPMKDYVNVMPNCFHWWQEDSESK